MTLWLALMKREILEHNNIWRVPLILVGIAVLLRVSLLFGNLDVNINAPSQLQLDSVIDSAISGAVARSLSSMNALILVIMFLVAIFYALSCLYNERQDQSVLFWRSLPISDSMTIVSKLAVAVLVIPLMIVVCQLTVAIVFLGGGVTDYLPAYFSRSLPGLISVVSWSLLPTVAWCLLCSAIARKNPFLLAFITPVLIVLVDKLFLSGQISQLLVTNRFSDVASASIVTLVCALVFTAACIVLAIIKRSQRI